MIDIKNVLEVINRIVLIPIALISFFVLMYIVAYLGKKDPDVIRSKIFLRYNEFKKAFLLLAAFAFVLIMHVLFIYFPDYLNIKDNPLIEDTQRFFGLTLALIMITFVYSIFKSIK
ncbi:Uncharacterised protein [uncultured archaeon]|nr:Uncharacterised protein [uncultured archaeon]